MFAVFPVIEEPPGSSHLPSRLVCNLISWDNTNISALLVSSELGNFAYSIAGVADSVITGGPIEYRECQYI